MDPFAQSRQDDDLFADDFEPVVEQTTIDDVSPNVVPENGSAAPETENLPTAAPAPDQRTNNRRGGGRGGHERGARGSRGGRGRGEARGRGRGRGATDIQNGLSASRYATQPEPAPAVAPTPAQAPPAPPASDPEPAPAPAPASDPVVSNEAVQDAHLDQEPPVSSSEQPLSPQESQPNSTAPKQDVSARTPAVRGDRSATGGPAHKKLTEEELTAKMEKMAIINAQKAERHRLSEADQAAFQHREKELAKERRERAVVERKNERAMEMERAKNRERKMRAQGGREWDSEKLESDIVDRKGRSSEYVRGGHGGTMQAGLANSRYSVVDESNDDNMPSAGRGRGGFEIRGRGGRGRGGRGGRGGKASSPTVPAPEEFPALSAVPAITPAAGDWADEMATPVEDKLAADDKVTV